MKIPTYLDKYLAFILTLLAGIALLTMNRPVNAMQSQQFDRNQWLKARFGAQHEKLIPIVAVADMYFSCQQEKTPDSKLTIKALLTDVDKNVLAEQLIECLDGASPKSDVALNYGLSGCFHEQLSELPFSEREQKMRLVTKAIASLSREERQKSFTQCVTDQAIHYLK